ncbi:hypothetical protein F5Y06DRAFT_76667 [Hypoxylon sp. FL0890]|nr:hypothetical protein F5Y06DRAFT_76667 [Hypoxylon sp. FL0890]
MNLSILLFYVLQMYSTPCHSFQLPRDQVCLHSNTTPLGESPLAELAELVPAIACSFVTTSYIAQIESARDNISRNVDSPTEMIFHIIRLDFLKNISPGLALGSCLVLGCCLSSYAHRRRDHDQFQVFVFVIWITWAVCIGWGTGATANRVTLGIVPWASCAAMLSSFFGHAGARWVSRNNCERGSDFTVINGKGASSRT